MFLLGMDSLTASVLPGCVYRLRHTDHRIFVPSSMAMAGWQENSSNENSTQYIDFSTIRKVGDIVNFWQLTDLRAAAVPEGGKQYLSVRSLVKIDCIEGPKQVLHSFYYSANMGSGQIIYSGSKPVCRLGNTRA